MIIVSFDKKAIKCSYQAFFCGHVGLLLFLVVTYISFLFSNHVKTILFGWLRQIWFIMPANATERMTSLIKCMMFCAYTHTVILLGFVMLQYWYAVILDFNAEILAFVFIFIIFMNLLQ